MYAHVQQITFYSKFWPVSVPSHAFWHSHAQVFQRSRLITRCQTACVMGAVASACECAAERGSALDLADEGLEAGLVLGKAINALLQLVHGHLV